MIQCNLNRTCEQGVAGLSPVMSAIFQPHFITSWFWLYGLHKHLNELIMLLNRWVFFSILKCIFNMYCCRHQLFRVVSVILTLYYGNVYLTYTVASSVLVNQHEDHHRYVLENLWTLICKTTITIQFKINLSVSSVSTLKPLPTTRPLPVNDTSVGVTTVPYIHGLVQQYGPRQANLCLRAFRHDKF